MLDSMLIDKVQILNGVKFVVIDSRTSKTKRSWFERLFSRPFLRKYKYGHHEMIEDGRFLTTDIYGQKYVYCNAKTFDRVKKLEITPKYPSYSPF